MADALAGTGKAPPSAVATAAARIGITEGQLYTITIGLLVGLFLAAVSVPNIHRGTSVSPGFGVFAVDTPTEDPGPDTGDFDAGTSPDATTPPGGGDATTGDAGPPPTEPGRSPDTTIPAGGVVAPPPPEPGTGIATDRGVTATTVQIAFLIDERVGPVGTAREFIRHFAQRDAETWVQAVNQSGGVAGRTLDAAVIFFDSAVPGSARAACRAATVERESFWVSAGGNPDVDCMASDAATLVTAERGLTSAVLGRAGGRAFTWTMPADVQLAAQADDLVRTGALTGATVGVVYQPTPAILDAVEDGLVPALERNGVDVAAAVETHQDDDDVARSTSAVVLALSGVDTVFLVADPFVALSWVEAADGAGFTPDYVMSDVGGGVSVDLPFPSSFRATGHSTTVGQHDRNSGTGPGPTPPIVTDCLADAARVGVQSEPPPPGASPAELFSYRAAIGPCRDLELFATVAAEVGPGLTRAAFAQALARLGSGDRWVRPTGARFSSAGTLAVRQRPIRWERPCPGGPERAPAGCWTVAGTFGSVVVDPVAAP